MFEGLVQSDAFSLTPSVLRPPIDVSMGADDHLLACGMKERYKNERLHDDSSPIKKSNEKETVGCVRLGFPDILLLTLVVFTTS